MQRWGYDLCRPFQAWGVALMEQKGLEGKGELVSKQEHGRPPLGQLGGAVPQIGH